MLLFNNKRRAYPKKHCVSDSEYPQELLSITEKIDLIYIVIYTESKKGG